jgi:hypothetical protein
MRTSQLLNILGLSAVTIFSGACAPVEDIDESGELSEAVLSSPSHYVRVRKDQRRCVSPLCGGFWVSRVNYTSMRCADGTVARECYVADLDTTALGLSEAANTRFGERLMNGYAITRGRIISRTFGSFGNLGAFIAQEGFDAVVDTAPTSNTVYLAHGPRRICVRAPCLSWDADKLNGTSSSAISSLPFARVADITAAQVSRAQMQLDSAQGVVVAGTLRETPGGGRELMPSQVYLRVSPGVSDATYCDDASQCVVATRGREVNSASDCYCALCPSTPLNVSTSDRYDRLYTRYCAAFRMTCPVARCIVPPTPVCVRHTCRVP